MNVQDTMLISIGDINHAIPRTAMSVTYFPDDNCFSYFIGRVGPYFSKIVEIEVVNHRITGNYIEIGEVEQDEVR